MPELETCWFAMLLNQHWSQVEKKPAAKGKAKAKSAPKAKSTPKAKSAPKAKAKANAGPKKTEEKKPYVFTSYGQAKKDFKKTCPVSSCFMVCF